jgi:hypothetical protein
MITPQIFIGVGGSGGKTLRAIRRELREVLASKPEWGPDRGFPVVWQFIHIDTPSIQDGQSFPAPLLSPAEYLGLVQPGVSLDSIILSFQSKPWEKEVLEEVTAPLPSRGEYTGHVDKGAGQYRGIGRTVALARLDQIKKQVEIAAAAIQGANAKAELELLCRIFNADSQISDVQPNVYIVSSLAGGSGSGQFMDVCEAVKAAAPGKSWVNNQTAILFAPDVFDDPKISVTGGIAPNSLATLNEVVSGFWRRKRTDISSALYDRFGFAKNEDGTFNVGPKSIYLVGKTNGEVTFDSQDDVYNAAAVSLSKLVVDPGVRQDIDHYISINEQSGPDPLRIKVDSHLNAPFNAMGFARLSLGLRPFARFSAQRLARAAVNQIVNGHKEGMGKANEDQWVNKIVTDEWERFWGQLGIDSKSIVEDIQPEAKRQMFRVGLTGELGTQSSLALNQKGLKPVATWIQDILKNVKKLTVEQQQIWRGYREVDSWAENTQKKIMAQTNESIARIGLRPTIQLLKLVRDALITNSLQNDIQPSVVDTALPNDLANIVKDSGASAEAQIGSDSEVVRRMLDLAGRGATSGLMQETKVLGHKLEEDLARNMITPMIAELEAKFRMLRDQMSDPSFHSDGKSLFDTWPNGDGVPTSFKPAPNEKYLIDWTNFDRLFDQLLVESVGVEQGKVRAAIDQSVRLLLQGSYSGRTSDDNQEWSVSDADARRWTPREGSSSAPRQWSASFAGELDIWEDTAQRFVRREGTAMARFLGQNLAQWLAAETEDASERLRRENALVDGFAGILTFSKPFVQINNVVMPLVHMRAAPKLSFSLSTIPVSLTNGDPNSVGSRIRELLERVDMWNGEVEKKFQGDASVAEIDVFGTLSSSLQHVVFDNLMEPISESWKIASPDQSQRAAFMLRRRGRNIPETIPMAPEKLDQFIRGWYVAKTLGRLSAEETALGVKISVWNQNPEVRSYDAFPHPAYYSTDFSVVDTMTIIAQSISIALAKVNEIKQLTPMQPYWSIMDLGGADVPIYVNNQREMPGKVSEELAKWLQSGTVSEYAPVPQPERAGSGSMSIDGRKAAVLAFLEVEEREFKENVVELPLGYRHTSLAWELRREIFKAFEDLRQQISQVGTGGSRV